MFATINLALKRIDHLACDTHVSVDVALLDPEPDGMPTDDDADALSDIEDELEEMIAGDAGYFGARPFTAGARCTGLLRRITQAVPRSSLGRAPRRPRRPPHLGPRPPLGHDHSFR